MSERKRKSSRGRRRRGRNGPRWRRWLALGIAAPFLLYLVAALAGSLVPVNSGWTEPEEGVPVYLASNDIHVDIVMPARAAGVDWEPLVPKSDFGAPPPHSRWIAFGSGEEKVYLETPRWSDITLSTIWSALTGGNRVMHVEWVPGPQYAARVIRLRPEEYRRLWAAVRADFQLDSQGVPERIDHPGYGPADAFYWSSAPRFSALSTCNSWAADKLRMAGVETSVWPPFAQGLLWRYRRADQST